jgi:triphosphoribosyl-dephospho-CoA synthetase
MLCDRHDGTLLQQRFETVVEQWLQEQACFLCSAQHAHLEELNILPKMAAVRKALMTQAADTI